MFWESKVFLLKAAFVCSSSLESFAIGTKLPPSLDSDCASGAIENGGSFCGRPPSGDVSPLVFDYDGCMDLDESCDLWSRRGECDINPGYMIPNCPLSCDRCDLLVKSQPHWVALESIKDYGVAQAVEDKKNEHLIMRKIYETLAYMDEQKTSGKLPPSLLEKCRNRHKLCAFWVAIGECDANPAWMVTNCAPSCFSCDLIDFKTRCPDRDPGMRPALAPGELHDMFDRIVRTSAAVMEDGEEHQFAVRVHSRPTEVRDERESPWVITIDRFLSDQECDHLQQLGQGVGYQRSQDVGGLKFDGSFDGYENNRRTSTNAWCDSRESKCRDDPIVQKVLRRIETLLDIPESYYEDFQILKYEVGQFYETHHDYINHQRERQCGPRILTFFLYLSNVEEGGGTQFPDINNLTVMPEKGKILLWPSVLNDDPMSANRITRHQALPVIKGLKYAANAWIHQYNYVLPQTKGCN